VLLSIAAFCACAGGANAIAPNPDVAVATLAGSGAVGIADGAALRASFIMPVGLAYAPDGTLYVADAGAQRIRAIDRAGNVRTVAGGGAVDTRTAWVTGGYHDGTGAEARFDRPMGIAWHDGALYVADANNHCIRQVLPDGTVTTFAGSPSRAGTTDGPPGTGALSRPLSLAFDSAGVLYVADPQSGMRTVAKDGTVGSVAALSGGTPLGVTIARTPHGDVVFVADLVGMLRRDTDGSTQRVATPDAYGHGDRQTQGFEPLGFPFAVAAFDGDSVVYTDVRGSAVRYLDWSAVAPQVLVGLDVVDGIATGAAYRDGSGGSPRVEVPMGIAIARDGTVAVADTGSRRIRLIRRFDRSHDARPASAVMSQISAGRPGDFRIAFVGNSYLWNYVRWSDSIMGIVETHTAPLVRAAHRRLAIEPFVFPGAPLDAEASWIEEVLAQTRAADLVVVNLNRFSLNGTAGLSGRPTPEELIAHAPQWTQSVTSALRDTRAALRAQGIALVVYTTPLPDDLSPTEGAWNVLVSGQGQFSVSPTAQIGDLMNGAVRAAGVPLLDGWAVFETELRSPDHAPLFGTQDEHFSAHGRAVIANALASFLAKLHPWQK
jgi:hypothetical protein